jgi:integrase/recombinase XerD
MTRLRKMMLEELQRRNFSEDTIRHYIRTVEDFARHFNRPPDRLGLQHIREDQAHLFQKRKLSSGSVTNHLAALRFFYIQTLKKAWSVAETPYPKKNHRLPAVLSQEEVARLIDAAGTPFHRTLLMTLYATGLRRAEVTHLKVNDIDSKRMVIHVHAGKGRKDRDVMLSPKLLEELRQHWLRLRRKTNDWLFPGNRWHNRPTPSTQKRYTTQRSKWVTIDADYAGALEDLLKMQYVLHQDKVEAALEMSKRGGHLWIFMEKPALARECRIYIYNLALKLGVRAARIIMTALGR